jgi:hypothetical protein
LLETVLKSGLGLPPEFQHSFKSMDRRPFSGVTQCIQLIILAEFLASKGADIAPA